MGPVSGTEKGIGDATDAELVTIARARDARSQAAFRALYDRYGGEVLGLLVPLVRDRDLAEDVLQETFFRIHLSLDRYDAARSFRPWLYQIARHAAADALRSRNKDDHARAGARAGPAGDEAGAEAARREDEELAARALDRLPEDLRALLVQRHALEMTLGELAESWSCAERTITTRLREAAGLFAQAVSLLRPRRRT
jgi:RNA polymerase sigma-70 factor (ECF subfamily)